MFQNPASGHSGFSVHVSGLPPGRGTTFPREEYAAEEKKYAAEEKKYAAEEKKYAAEEKKYAAEEKKYAAEEKKYAAEEKKYAAEEKKYAAEEKKYAAEEKKYAAEEKKYAAEGKRYAAEEKKYAAEGKANAAWVVSRNGLFACRSPTLSRRRAGFGSLRWGVATPRWSLIALLASAASAWFLAGLIWVIQLVHYAQFDAVGAGAWPGYHARHMRGITFVVAPAMFVELAATLWLLWRRPAAVPAWLVWASAAAVAGLWLSTALVQVPLHTKLGGGAFDPAAAASLVRTNWVRTILWSGRAGLMLWALWLVAAAT